MSHASMQDKSLWHALLLAVVLAGMTLVAPASAWALTYTFTTLDVPGSGLTEAYGINNAGQIVGNFVDATGTHGFLYTGGNFLTLDVPDSTSTFALGINTAGQIVGAFMDTTARRGTHGFLYTGGSFTTLDVPGSTSTYAYGINTTGQIVGQFSDATGGHGFLHTGGNFTTIDVPGSSETGARGINAAGQIVGQFSDATGGHGFLHTGGNFTTIDVPGSSETGASGINTAGQIVGFFSLDRGATVHGFLYTGGNFTTIDVPGNVSTNARGINNTGQIVGVSLDATGYHGFLATPVPTTPPVVTISATPATLWPPNGRMVPVTIAGTITDADSDVDVSTAAYAVIDEYRQVQPMGSVTLRSDGRYSFTIQLQASRNNNDQNGRQYLITVSALDTVGNMGSAPTAVIVPHDQGQ